MTEHDHLDAWLRLAEQAVASHDWTRVTYAAAKDDVRRFEVRNAPCVYACIRVCVCESNRVEFCGFLHVYVSVFIGRLVCVCVRACTRGCDARRARFWFIWTR